MRDAPHPPAMRCLVTGAGSGIGLAAVQALSAAGHHVWAGARRDDDLARLGALHGVTPLRLDVRHETDALAALRALQASGAEGLDGLVHSAGIGELGHLAAWSDADVQRVFETNVHGPMRLTRLLLPLLLRSRGRVVAIGSMGGSITQPLYGPYSMSKFALEAWSDCLRQELAPHGVAVSIVQPGAVSTRIGHSAAAGTQARLAATPPPFDADARAVLDAMQHPTAPDPHAPESAANRRPASAGAVAEVVMQALTAPLPQPRYLVGTRWEGERVLRELTDRLIDAATSPGQRMDREALLAWVDAAWRERGPG